MNITNFEFKARVHETEKYEKKLQELNPVFQGIDYQIDTYFNALKGRLKLREGNIENALIHYNRANIKGAKASQILLYKHQPDTALKNILIAQFGIKVVVDKKRKIYFIDNVKFHFDEVAQLGSFIEVEVISENENISVDELKKQCDFYIDFFELTPAQMELASYSDLILAIQ
ncbi:MAG: CYTH domain-containing protein [Chitinophagaceae bacterium]|nr:MAG: CYTH domain-containing protein [Chitinophagaceae bacterium]